MVVFVGVGTGGIQQLFARPLDEIGTRPIPGTVGAVMPFFSTDSKWLGFWLNGSLRKVPLEGGAVVPLADVGGIFGASWAPNNMIIVSTGSGLATIPAAGGALGRLTTPDSARGEEDQRWPLALADGKTVLYTSWGHGGLNAAKIGVASLETGRSTILELPGTFPLGVVDGLLVYASASGALMAVSFDAGRSRVLGDPAPVVTDVLVGLLGPAKAGMSRNGSLVYQIGARGSQLVLADGRGVTRPLSTERERYSFPRFSPDGKQIAVAIRSSAGSDVWIYDPAQGTTARLTTDSNSCCPEWTPDGKRVLFVSHSNREERAALWWRPADRSGPAAPLLKLDGADLFTGLLSPDGQTLVYETTTYEIGYRRLTGDTASKRIAPASAIAATPSLSPDGRWLAYVSNESGTGQVVVQPFPGPGAHVQVSTDGGIEPVWARGGHRLFYRHNRQIIAAKIKAVPTFAVTGRAVVFEGPPFAGSNMHTHYDVSPRGTEFLFVKMVGDVQTIIVHDWRDELRSRLAARAATAAK
ncbi:MAG TPA: hypothetical protein VHE78_06550, partial [Gemmatimonadaceae bacterium]|nr:hypothetical protein [Gemmatimonadaceae bacterium]